MQRSGDQNRTTEQACIQYAKLKDLIASAPLSQAIVQAVFRDVHSGQSLSSH